MKKLDRRIAKSPQQGTIQPKKRIASTPSACEAPAVYPNWAVKEYRSCGTAASASQLDSDSVTSCSDVDS